MDMQKKTVDGKTTGKQSNFDSQTINGETTSSSSEKDLSGYSAYFF
jgi:hypothetical protein